jgi:hypothetical protein
MIRTNATVEKVLMYPSRWQRKNFHVILITYSCYTENNNEIRINDFLFFFHHSRGSVGHPGPFEPTQIGQSGHDSDWNP